MNLEAIALTAIIAIVVFGAAIVLGTHLTWANRYESRIIKAIRERNAGTGDRPPEDDA